jgi:hypothetical protein
MSRFSRFVRRATKTRGVAKARHLSERAVAPYLRADLTSLHHDLVETIERLNRLQERVDAIEEYQPAVLNAISSTNGNARLLRRELDGVRAELEALQRQTTP